MNRRDILNPRSFYTSRAWAEIRYKALIRAGGRCQACGASSGNGARLHVDHVKPRSLYPELALNPDNLQVLCATCNSGKSWLVHDPWTRTARSPEAEQIQLPLQLGLVSVQ